MPRKFLKSSFGPIAVVLILVSFFYLSRRINLDVTLIQNSLLEAPLVFSSLLYVILYVVMTFFIFFSKDIFWLMGAFLFGPFFSAFLICIAEVINAFILFYASRILGRAYVEKRLSGKYRKLDEKIGKIGLFWLFILRAAPLIPYRFLDLASGLTSLRFRKYLVAVVLGTPVKMFWIQYIIYSVGKNILEDPTALMRYFLEHKILLFFSYGYIILIIMAIVKLFMKDNKDAD